MTVTGTSTKAVLVLPVYNEAKGIIHFHKTLVETLEPETAANNVEFSFIYVNDGSTDNSLEILQLIETSDTRVSVIDLSRNYGHQVAVSAGLDRAAETDADCVIIMDTDLQDPPAVILDMLSKWRSGVDVVYAARLSRKDTFLKKLTASAFYKILAMTSDVTIPRNTGDFRLIDRQVLLSVVKHREHDRFLRGIIASVGYKQEPVYFHRDARFAGASNYPLKSMLKLAASGLFGFSTLPLRWITILGFIISVLSFLGALVIIGLKIFAAGAVVPGWSFIMVSVFALGGVQLLTLGILGHYVGRIYGEVLNRPLYNIREDRVTDTNTDLESKKI